MFYREGVGSRVGPSGRRLIFTIVSTHTTIWAAKRKIAERQQDGDNIKVWENAAWVAIADAELYK